MSSFDSRHHCFEQCTGILGVEAVPVELQRLARVTLGRMLGVLGDDLTARIAMLRAQAQGGVTDMRTVWRDLALLHGPEPESGSQA